MRFTQIEKRFILAMIAQMHRSITDEKIKAVYADSYVRVEADDSSANIFIKVLAEKVLETVDKTLLSPVVSEEVRVRAQTIKDAFLGIKEKVEHVTK